MWFWIGSWTVMMRMIGNENSDDVDVVLCVVLNFLFFWFLLLFCRLRVSKNLYGVVVDICCSDGFVAFDAPARPIGGDLFSDVLHFFLPGKNKISSTTWVC